MNMDRYLIKPGKKIDLAKDYDPDDYGDYKGEKDKGVAKLADLRQELDQLQNVLYAEHKHKVLVVIQAMDTAGKDGTIRSVFEGVNPQGVKVASFKVPTPLENDHDFLWRVHANVPGKGELVLFNRSHYEQVLVVRVHSIEPESEWRAHYRHINDFERLLADTGTTIVKFFLNISLAEQKQRLLERIDTPEKQWKFSPGDLPERKLWPEYMKAYEEAISETSTEWAPWYVVPSNHNWYRNLVVASVIVDTMKKLKLSYPPVVENLDKYRSELDAEPDEPKK
jgi:PPK2 family polyphosphate:nucleotide phosphotransferase